MCQIALPFRIGELGKLLECGSQDILNELFSAEWFFFIQEMGRDEQNVGKISFDVGFHEHTRSFHWGEKMAIWGMSKNIAKISRNLLEWMEKSGREINCGKTLTFLGVE